ncbi:hypothetical protein ACFLV5_05920, partial [Chloroflexota bacterium]
MTMRRLTMQVAEYFSAVERIKDLKAEITAINASDKQGDLAMLETELDELQQQNAVLADTVERIIEKQIRETLSQEGIFNPADKYLRLKVGFPPINFKLGQPPHLFVISPRDKIESMREIPLKQDISLEIIENVEAGVDELGVSSLIVE